MYTAADTRATARLDISTSQLARARKTSRNGGQRRSSRDTARHPRAVATLDGSRSQRPDRGRGSSGKLVSFHRACMVEEKSGYNKNARPQDRGNPSTPKRLSCVAGAGNAVLLLRTAAVTRTAPCLLLVTRSRAMAVTTVLVAARIRPSLARSACWMVVQAALLFASCCCCCCCCAFQVQPSVFAAAPPHTSRTAPGVVPNTNANANRLCDLPRRLPDASARTGRTSSGACPSPWAGLRAAAEGDGDALGGGGGDGDGGFAADKRYRRKPRGDSLIRDSVGLPVEKVYAPRQSA